MKKTITIGIPAYKAQNTIEECLSSINIQTMRDNIEVAVKKEMKKPQKIPQLRTEAKIYQTLLNIPLNSDMSGMSALAQEDVQGVTKFYGTNRLLLSHN